MKKILLASSILAVSAANVPLAIADDSTYVEAYLGTARYLWDDDRNLDNEYSFEGGLELPVTDNFSVETWYSLIEPEIDGTSTEIEGDKYSLGGLYHFTNDDLRPFITLGGSHQEFEFDSGTSADESLVYLGIGGKKYFENNFVARLELLAMNSIDYEVTDMAMRLSVGYAFGRDTSKPVMPVDSDNDGIMDPSDQCPGTPAGTRVDSKGCAVPVDSDNDGVLDSKDRCPGTAAGVEVDGTGCPVKKDADKDGVIDENDKCPGTPAGVRVDSTGCFIDSDKDGVADELDLCPDTDAAFKVDAKGCAVTLAETVNLDIDVKFKSNSDEIARGKEDVKELADFLKKFKDTNVTVEGYTDSRGSDAYNKQLSQKRADAVKTLLAVEYGIDPARITAFGYGEANPIASNDTPEGREANRRVVAKVSATVKEAVKK